MNFSATDIVLIIGAMSVAITSIISAFKVSTKLDIASTKRDTNQAVNASKLEEIHTSTNGNLSRLMVKIEAMEKKAIVDTESLHTMQEIVKNLTIGSSVNIIDPSKK
jgi:hypothetical protein